MVLLLAAICLAACATDDAAQRFPLSYSGPAEQMITVVADRHGASTATFSTWDRTEGRWQLAHGPISAHVGEAGIGSATEGSTRTPAGIWPLTEAFGNETIDSVRLPYRRLDSWDWWVSDTASASYNTHYRCTPGTCPFDERAGENLTAAGPAYDNAVVIDYNRSPAVPGAGSAFFLHNSSGGPTAGCVAIPASDLRTVLRWLDPARHPAIALVE